MAGATQTSTALRWPIRNPQRTTQNPGAPALRPGKPGNAELRTRYSREADRVVSPASSSN